MEKAVRAVFEPTTGPIRRAVGHPAAPLTADSMVVLLKARLTAVEHLNRDQVTDEDFLQARQQHLITYAGYAAQQPVLAAAAPAGSLEMYEPVTTEIALNGCCTSLLTVLGFEILGKNTDVR